MTLNILFQPRGKLQGIILKKEINLSKSFSIIIIFVLTLIIYSNTLNSPFHFDDEKVIVKNESVRDIKNFSKIFFSNPSRPVLTFSFALNFWFGRLTPFSYHLVNILLHGLNGVLLFLILSLTFTGNLFIPLFASLIFVSHPVNIESVTYISSRSGVLCTFFYLLSVLFFIKFLRNIKNSSLSGWLSKPAIPYSLSILFFILSMGTKETGITLPIFLILYEICFSASTKQDKSLLNPPIPPFDKGGVGEDFLYVRNPPLPPFDKGGFWGDLLYFRYKLYYIPFFAIIGFIIVLRKYFFGTFGNPTFYRDYYQNLLTQGRALWAYIKLLFFPINLNVDHEFFLSNSFLEFRTLLSFAGILVLFFFAFRYLRKSPGVSFCVLFFFLAISPTSLIPLQDILSERWLYLPGIGFCLFLALVIMLFLNPPLPPFFKGGVGGLLVMGIILILFFSILTFTRNSVWNSEISLWKDATLKSPRKARTYNNLGVALAKSKRYDEAMESFKKAIRLNKYYSPAIGNLGKAYMEKGEKALMLEMAVALSECGEYYTEKGMFKEAIISYNELIKLVPESIAAYGNLGIIYMMLNEKALAREQFEKVLKYSPENEAAKKFLKEIDGNKK